MAKKTSKKPAKKAAKKAVKKEAKKSVKKAVKAAPAKKAEKPAAKPARKPNPAFMKAMVPSAALAAVIGNTPVPRTEIIKKLWEYIRNNGLQDQTNKRMINADAKLKVLFEKDQVSMFELAKVVNNHAKAS